MVQSDIAQLTGECTGWRETLRNFREEFNQCKSRLQQLASRPLSKEDLHEVEHYHNQFHIQLINIHDLKQAIKQHERKVNVETAFSDSQVTDETLADHENLYDQYQQLEDTLQALRQDFDVFSKRTN
ncbi:MAG: hypothetical protein ABW019_01050 [Chitinophagaceae bacterium]